MLLMKTCLVRHGNLISIICLFHLAFYPKCPSRGNCPCLCEGQLVVSHSGTRQRWREKLEIKHTIGRRALYHLIPRVCTTSVNRTCWRCCISSLNALVWEWSEGRLLWAQLNISKSFSLFTPKSWGQLDLQGFRFQMIRSVFPLIYSFFLSFVTHHLAVM